MYPIRFAGENDTLGPSANIWHHTVPLIAAHQRGEYGAVYAYQHDDFSKALDDEEYVVTQAGAGTFLRVTPTNAATSRNVARIDVASTTENQGINVQYGLASAAAIPAFIPLAGHTIFFECMLRFNESLTTSPPDFFVGLSEADTTIIASGANSSANHVGFEIIDEDGTLDFVSEKASSRDKDDTVTTVVEDTFYKLGFIIHGVTKIEKFIDGVVDPTVMTDTNDLPIVAMAPSFVAQASGTASAQPEVDIDWWQCLQVPALMPGLNA